MPYDAENNWYGDQLQQQASTPPGTVTLDDGSVATLNPETGKYAVPQKPAGSVAAQLLRSQYEDWQKTYKPIELAAINNLSFNNPEVLPRALTEARVGAEGYSNSMAGILSRQTRALGQQPTEGQKTTSDRLLNLNRAATIASSENIARENIRTQDEQILLGGAPNPNVQKAP